MKKGETKTWKHKDYTLVGTMGDYSMEYELSSDYGEYFSGEDADFIQRELKQEKHLVK